MKDYKNSPKEFGDRFAAGRHELTENGIKITGSLYCYNDQLTSNQIKHFNRHHFTQGEIGHNWIYADGILTVVKNKRQFDKYTYYQGKHRNSVITDGVNWAHCRDLKSGIIDLRFKAEKRDMSQYADLTPDSEVSYEDAVIMYRVITGACQAGTEDFLSRMSPEQVKDRYKVSEICEITDGQYNSGAFKKYFAQVTA